MKGVLVKIIFSLFMVLFFVGCGDSSSTQTETFSEATQTEVYFSTVADGVAINSKIELHFSQAISDLATNINLVSLSNIDNSSNVMMAYEMSQDKLILTLSPLYSTLSANAYYQIDIPSNFEYDDNSTLGTPFSYEFYTASSSDITPPTVIVQSPDTNISFYDAFKVTTDEPIDLYYAKSQTVNFVNDVSSDTIPAIAYLSSTQMMYAPSRPLEVNASYTISLPIIYDLAGQATASTPYTISTSTTNLQTLGSLASLDINSTVVMFSNSSNYSFAFIDSNNTINKILYNRMMSGPNTFSSELNISVIDPIIFMGETTGTTPQGLYLITENNTTKSMHYLDYYDSNLTYTVSLSDLFSNPEYLSVNLDRAAVWNSSELHFYSYTNSYADQNFTTDSNESLAGILDVQLTESPRQAYVTTDSSQLIRYNIESSNTPSIDDSIVLGSNAVDFDIDSVNLIHLITANEYFLFDENLTVLGSLDLNASSELGSDGLMDIKTHGEFVFISQENSSDVIVLNISQLSSPYLFMKIPTISVIKDLKLVNSYGTFTELIVVHYGSMESIKLFDIFKDHQLTTPYFDLGPVDENPVSMCASGGQGDRYYVAKANTIYAFDTNDTTLEPIVTMDINVTKILNIHYAYFIESGMSRLIVTHKDGFNFYDVSTDVNGTLSPTHEIALSAKIQDIIYYSPGTYDTLVVSTADQGLFKYEVDSNGSNVVFGSNLTTHLELTSLGIDFEGGTNFLYVGKYPSGFDVYSVDSFGDLNKTEEVSTVGTVTDFSIAPSEIDFLVVSQGMYGIDFFEKFDFNVSYPHLKTHGYVLKAQFGDYYYGSWFDAKIAEISGFGFYEFDDSLESEVSSQFIPAQNSERIYDFEVLSGSTGILSSTRFYYGAL
jgi:hypothetical protein